MITAALAAFLNGISPSDIPLPPERYDYIPKRAIEIEFTPFWGIKLTCKRTGKRYMKTKVLGCYPLGSDKIYVVKGMPRKLERRVIRHEYGHVNGWSKHHGR